MSIAEQIHAGLTRYSKEQLIQMLHRDTAHHNQFCRRANGWRIAMCAMARAMKPFAEAINELEEESDTASRVGGYVPTSEEWATASVPTSALYAAREAIALGEAGLVSKFDAEMNAARICIEALKELEQEGNTIAAVALAKVRQVDPHI